MSPVISNAIGPWHCSRLPRQARFRIRRWKTIAAGLFLVVIMAGSARAADSVVVFNEIHYHPPTNEAVQEWIELHNQMAIDIDLSAWSITGTINYPFAEGTIIPGGGYLVVASDPPTLQARTGLSNVLGPFLGRLNNSLGTLRLRDRNDRLMDELEYRDGGKWPVAPDGSGATLAKRNPDSTSDDPTHWASSVAVNGTPGARNFPSVTAPRRQSLVPFNALWQYEASGTDLGTDWRRPDFDDTDWPGRNSATLVAYWPFDENATATRGVNGSFVGTVSTTADRNGVAGGALAFSGASQQYVSVAGGGGLNGATAGTVSLWVKWTGTQDADCCGTFGAVLARQANGQFSDDILALNTSSPGAARVVWRQSGGPAPILITGTTVVGESWHHLAVTFAPGRSALYVDGVLEGTAAGAGLNNNPGIPLSIGAWAGDGAGFSTASVDDVAIWDQPLTAAQIGQLAAQSRTPLSFASPESAVYYAGSGRLATSDELRRTALPLGPTTYYFRTTFPFADDPADAELTLELAVNDGAVFYLNGVEVHRHNMPAGAPGYGTLAATAVGDAPIVQGIRLPTTNLLRGTNVFAVEVHQAASEGDPDLVFGANLFAEIRPAHWEDFSPGGLVFNELEAAGSPTFQIELVNHGAAPLDATGYVVQRTGASPDAEYLLPSHTLPAGGFLVLSESVLGFGAGPGDKLFLRLPGGRGVADAVEVHERPRARSPDGVGDWMTPEVFTPGASNRFTPHGEVVINEIMYHAPPTLEVPAVPGTNTLISLTNLWRYEQSGTDLGTAWRAPDYDDAAWPIGAGLFYVTTNALPAEKNTELTLGPTTYYFRTTFVCTGAPAILSLTLRHVVDDGAVFYLNGTEISRFNMRAGVVNYTNNTSGSVLNAILRTPVEVALTNLVPGTNVLAVEVHQAAISGDDMAFGAELTAGVEAMPRVPFSESPEQWLELFNRSSNTVNLTGWRIDEGIDFRFASNTVIPAGGYLVVARDPEALGAKFPGIAITGPFENSLSHRGERIVLRDAEDNPADVVQYFDGGRWPGAADAGGSSLELRDPWADNAAAEAWAASDERHRSSWRAYRYRGIAAASPVGPDGQWREFVMGLLDEGEILLDDLSVIETPATTPVELLQNGTFETGTNQWRIIGNHRGEVIDDPDTPGNQVLRLVASGPTEHMSNHGETTLANGRDTVNGREYLISFRAKWIRGSRQFHTRLYFNRLPRVTLLDAPTLHGTPGSRNSTFTTNTGPTYGDFRHEPAVPAPYAPVTVTVRATDPDGVAGLTLWSAVDGGSWTSSPMVVSNGGGYTGTIAGKAGGAVVQFYVTGVDGLGATSAFPAAGPDSRALYKVDDGLAATNGLHNFRIVTLTADTDELHRTVNLMSNGRVGCTVIYDEREIFYDVSLRLKGSEHSRTTTPRLGFNVGFASQQPFRGIHRTVAIDRSESTGFGQREMLMHQMLNHAGGVPTKYHDLIQVLAPRPEHTGSAELQLARYTDVFLDDQFQDGSQGMVFEYELIYQLNSTDTGTPEGNKVPAPDSVVGTSIRNLGDSRESYRWNFLIKNNEDRDDYSGLIPFCQAMELSGAGFIAAITNRLVVDQWLRGVAVNALTGAGDSYGGDGAQHNVQFYVRPEDQRVLYFPHDMDAFFSATRPIIPNNDLGKLIAVPAHARAYYGHLLDIIATTYNGAYLARWADHFGRLLPAQDFAGHLAFIVQRANYVTSLVNAAVPNVAFAITSHGGDNFDTTNDTITLTGTAPLAVSEIQVNGVSYPLTWLGTTAWSLRLPLFNGPNALTVQGVDRHGARLTNALDTISVTNTGPGAFRPVVINEWMADNAGPTGHADPLDGLFQDWFELFNPNTNAINLAGFFLTDRLSQPAKWTIPPETIIAPRGFLLVWADNQPEQNGLGADGALHAAFQLNNDGEAIGLFTPDGVAQHAVAFGTQWQNVSQGLFPDGDTNALHFMTNFTPRAANIMSGPLRLMDVSLQNDVVTVTWSAVTGRAYQVFFKDDLGAPAWTPLGGEIVADGVTASASDLLPPTRQRYYRVQRIESP